MKNRRIILVAFMLVAVLCLGVGYAALTDLLIVDGTAVVNQQKENLVFDEKIEFTKAEVKTATTADYSGIADTATVDSSNTDKVSFTVKSLARQGQKATFEFTVTNTSEFDATLALEGAISNTANADYFSVTYSFKDNDNTCEKTNGTVVIIVEVELIKAVTTEINGTFNLTFKATTTT